MRAGGTKSTLIKALKAETQATTVPHILHDKLQTAVVVDAMFAVRQWSFHKGETFGAIAKRYLHNMLNDIPGGTASIHFCCDRYDTDNLKASQHQHRYAKSEKAKVFEVSEQYITPAPQDFFPISAIVFWDVDPPPYRA